MTRVEPEAARPEPLEIGRANAWDVRIKWKDGHESVYPARFLRMQCPCAACVGETTGQPLVRGQDVPSDVHPLKIEPVGRYAVQVLWSDGHRSGIYPFDRLRKICPCAGCREGKRGSVES